MEIHDLVQRQRAFYHTDCTLDAAFRINALNRLSDTIKRMESEINQALKSDLNKSASEAFMVEIGPLLSEIAFVRRHLKRWARVQCVPTSLTVFPGHCRRVPEPYGIVLVMAPWNYPLLLSLEPLVDAIAAGNCVIVKPSAYSPATSHLIKKILNTCFPEEYCAVVEGSREENTLLLAERFDFIFFTGSMAVGKVVMEAAARHLTPVVLELGGKSPVIVDETADLRLTARRLVFGKFINAGQTCIAPDYVFVKAEKKAELIENLKAAIEQSYPRDAEGQISDYPRIVNARHFDRLNGLMRNEKIVYGGGTDADSLTIEPTLLNDVRPDAPIMQEEIFGPLLPILPYQNIEEVIGYIRAHNKPLALYLFSKNRALWQRIERSVSFGGGCINDSLMHVLPHSLPFGGAGESGMGQYHGKTGFDTFTHYKSVLRQSTRIDLPLRYRPVAEWKDRIIHKILSIF